jgi:hypothetical protein
MPIVPDGSRTPRAWREFDHLVAEASTDSPWRTDALGERSFLPDYSLLANLLAVPVRLGSTTQSGMPAKAVDVWVAHELRRAGFLPGSAVRSHMELAGRGFSLVRDSRDAAGGAADPKL